MAVIEPIINLEVKPHGMALLETFCRHRGCKGQEEIGEFLAQKPAIRNPYANIPDVAPAIERILRAIDQGERICVFGDFDADGITSTVQMLDYLEAHGAEVDFFIPDRAKHNYGLTPEAIKDCLQSRNYKLFIVLDCGSTRIDSVDLLQSMGIDSIVIDHHDIPESQGKHSCLAHLNPKDWANSVSGIEDLCEMSAAGLVFLFIELLDAERKAAGWNRNRALILAGLGSMVDVMPLTKINRALVKNSLRLINNPLILQSFPGMQALIELGGIKGKVTPYAYGFVIGPMLNATGRMGSAGDSVATLRSKCVKSGRILASILKEQNDERKRVQKDILDGALAQADRMLAENPDLPVIIVHERNWHAGIVGIVAGRLKERFERPVFVLGWNPDENRWKGSGRSVPGCDLGHCVHMAVDHGVICGGGGHPMAAGISVDENMVEPFREWICSNIDFDPTTYSPAVEVLGHLGWSSITNWDGLLQRLEPFGSGNPRPFVVLENSRVLKSPTPLRKRSNNEIWGYRVSLSVPFPGQCRGANNSTLVDLTIHDDRQIVHFKPDSVLTLTASVKISTNGSATYQNIDLHKIVE